MDEFGKEAVTYQCTFKPESVRRIYDDTSEGEEALTVYVFMKNGERCIYRPGEWDDYQYDKKCFIVIKEHRYIGIYNIDSVECVQVEADG